MPKRLSYSIVSKVVEIWELAKSKPNFEEKVGTDLLLKYVLKDCGGDDLCQSSMELQPNLKFFLHHLECSSLSRAQRESFISS